MSLVPDLRRGTNRRKNWIGFGIVIEDCGWLLRDSQSGLAATAY